MILNVVLIKFIFFMIYDQNS